MKHALHKNILAVAVVMLATGGCGAKRDAAKEAPIDWSARAALVKDGMTRAEVDKILPEWKPSSSSEMKQTETSVGNGVFTRGIRFGIGSGTSGSEGYLVAEDWRVVTTYRRDNSDNQKYLGARANQIMRNANDQELWMAKAASIKVGMTRAEADRYMPAWAGIGFRCYWYGKDNSSREVYQFADNWFPGTNYTWSLTIDYDRSGGDGSMQNRVINPVKIETVKKPPPSKPTP